MLSLLVGLQVMIARADSRRKGLATEALQLMMAYAVKKLQVTQFLAKIKDWNSSSIKLFSKIGFAEEKKVPVFQEVHLVLDASVSATQWQLITKHAACLQILPFPVSKQYAGCHNV
jgi:Acetyltransferase (GNAT) domain